MEYDRKYKSKQTPKIFKQGKTGTEEKKKREERWINLVHPQVQT